MVDSKKVLEIIDKMKEDIVANKAFLTELDNVIGDGDHGINLARGFSKVEEKYAALEGKDIGTILKTVGMTLVSTVGGASGPLYGTAFMKAGAYLNGKTEIDFPMFIGALKEATAGIKLRGKSTTGEKTMLDAIVPATEAMEKNFEETGDSKQALLAGVKAAEEGVEYTKTIIATKGRASYLGERSIGHQDPGATSFTHILTVIANEI
ncbi:MAG: dihydroxyacetone kinase subunit DhaL [Lachnospiraceae bacterium]